MTSPPERTSASRRVGSHIDSLGTISCILLALIVIGFASFRFAPVVPTGASQNVDKAFFSSVNLVTLTGFVQSSAAVADYPREGLWLIAILSVISAGTILTGAGIFLSAVFGLNVSGFRVGVYSAVVLLASALTGLAAGSVDAISAATGLGLTTTRSPDAWLRALLITTSIPAAIGPVLLVAMMGLRSSTRRRGTLASCFVLLAGIYLVGLLLLKWTGSSWLDASLASIDTRSFGSGFVPLSEAGKATQWSMAGMMLVGSGPGSVAGGLSVLPIAILLRGGWKAMRGGRVDPLVGVSIAWIGAQILCLFALVISLAASQPQLPGDRMLFLAISAICNVGLSHDPVSLSRDGMYLLSAAMLLGRLLPLGMLCWMACVAEHEANRETRLPGQ